nr:competence protein CoiA family protein [Cryobacterium sp. BB736]
MEDDQAVEHRDFVKSSVVCPVPGCAAPLTTVHSTRKRDHLRHLVGTGGHAAESIFHSQGCALVESWLREKYPRSRVTREEYTSETGERRADVMLTGPQGHRVAFEVQYSPLTPDAWRRRHDSYRAQGIVDVWLFGHAGKQLRLDRDDHLLANPTHAAVVDSGSALLFINPDPDRRQIAIAVGADWRIDAQIGQPTDRAIEVLHSLERSRLEVHQLEDFHANLRRGLVSDRLEQLYEQSDRLRSHNALARVRAVEFRARVVRERAEQQQRWEARRAPQQASIRDLLGGVERWSKSEALVAIQQYFGPDLQFLNGRIDRNTTPGAPPDLLIRWQCVVYFDLIAGQSTPFGTREAYNAIKRRGVKMDEKIAFRDVARFLYELASEGFLHQRPGYGKYPTFQPTASGAWW